MNAAEREAARAARSAARWRRAAWAFASVGFVLAACALAAGVERVFWLMSACASGAFVALVTAVFMGIEATRRANGDATGRDAGGA